MTGPEQPPHDAREILAAIGAQPGCRIDPHAWEYAIRLLDRFAAQRVAEAVDYAVALQRSVEWFADNGNAPAEAACRRALAKAATPPPGDAGAQESGDA